MVLAANVGDYEHCVDGHAYVVAPCLLPGTYMIEMDWSPNVRGSVYTQLQGLSPNVIGYLLKTLASTTVISIT